MSSSDIGSRQAWYPGRGFPIVTGTSIRSSSQVAVTVVSVGPYVFTMRSPGLASRPTRAGGQASPPRLIRRTDCGRRAQLSSDRAISMMPIRVGTALTIVTPRLAQIAGKPGTSRHSERVPIARWPAPATVTHISSTNMSKAGLKPFQTTSPCLVLSTCRSLREKVRAADCEIAIPFGVPVVPDV